VERAQQEQAPIERIAEHIATAFIPVVWLAAIGSAVYWWGGNGNAERAGLSALAVLVVACPCALGLATPIATSLAIGRSARNGVLIRSGDVLERLSAIRTIFFDKTGTLTNNLLSVDRIITASDDINTDEVLAWAATVEIGSEHIIADAITAEAKGRGISTGQLLDFKAIPGHGTEGNVLLNGNIRRIIVGSLRLLSGSCVLPESLNAAMDSNSMTTVYVGWDGGVQACIVLRDAIRPESVNAMSELRSKGIKTVVISGDQYGPTKRIAHELRMDKVIAECNPVDKAEVIQKEQKRSPGAVAMVGDGINDAPALAEADVGIAVGGGTDLARQSSEITLMGDDISRIPEMLTLADFTYRVIKQNLWWAFGYNSLAITAAFFGYVHPLIAATAMLVSSVTIIANSTRILRLKQGTTTCVVPSPDKTQAHL
jgi:heavy metal translocating P-type ATPase